MPVYDAWIDSDINLIHTRHEAGAVHMADAWGRLTGTLGVALIAGGPGFSNGLSAMYVAKMAESPVVVLSGHVALATLGKGSFQEMPQAEIGRYYAKASWLVRDVNEIGHAIRRAFMIAKQGRPGPVHVSLPSDLLGMAVDAANNAAPTIPAIPNLEPTKCDAIVQAIRAAQRPLVLAGSAVMHSAEFAAAQHPFATANLPLIGTESPRGINDPSLGAFASVLAQADLLVLIGKKLDFTFRFGQAPFIKEGTRVIQVDADEDVLALTRTNGATLELVDLIHADPVDALRQLTVGMSQWACDAGWAQTVAEAIAYVPPEWGRWVSGEGEALFSAEIGRTIHNFLAEDPDGIMISDGGEFGQWAQATIKPPHRIINGMSGSIGVAVPFGLAARLAYPNARIVVCSGDGGFGFLPLEIETAVRNNLPFTTVIGNDARWNAEYQIQVRNYGADRIKGVELNQTNYHEVVRAVGGWGAQVTDVAALNAALHAAHASGLPACINATIRGEAAPVITQTE